jgi:hypothetical protein
MGQLTTWKRNNYERINQCMAYYMLFVLCSCFIYIQAIRASHCKVQVSLDLCYADSCRSSTRIKLIIGLSSLPLLWLTPIYRLASSIFCRCCRTMSAKDGVDTRADIAYPAAPPKIAG